MNFAGNNNRDLGRTLLVCLLLTAAVSLVYWPVTGHGFISLDDGVYVTDNSTVRRGLNWEGVRWAFTSFHSANWHPLTWLSHMLDCHLFGQEAGWHHGMSLFLHAVNTVLLFLALRLMTGTLWRCATVAAFFALHPLRVESVAWIAERKDLLAGLFWMLTILAYAWYASRPRIGRYVLVALLYALGLMAKPMLVTLPFVLLLLDIWPLKRWSRNRDAEPAPGRRSSAALLLEKAPLIALSAASSAVTLLSQGSGGGLRSFETLPLTARAANALTAYLTYVGKMIWPASLAVFYPHPAYVEQDPRLLVVKATGSAVLLSVVTLIVLRQIRQRPYLPVGWFWYLGTLVPVIGLVQVGAQGIADRYTYLPSIGLLLAAVWGVAGTAKLRRSRRLLTTVVVLLLIVCGTAARFQLRTWNDSATLYEHALRVTRDNYLAHNSLGKVLIEDGRLDLAERHLDESLRIMPRSADAHNSLGVLYSKQSRNQEAARQFENAIRLRADFVQAHVNLGGLLARQGDLSRAVSRFERALQIDPACADAHAGLGMVRMKQRWFTEALPHFERALRIRPDLAEVRNEFGLALVLSGDSRRAVDELQHAIRLRDDYAGAHGNLGMVLMFSGDADGAVRHFRRALSIRPTLVAALQPLAWILATTADPSLRDGKEAVGLAEQVVAIAGDSDAAVLDTVAAAYAEADRWEEAVTTAEKAVAAAFASGQPLLGREIEARLDLYRQRRPFRERIEDE